MPVHAAAHTSSTIVDAIIEYAALKATTTEKRKKIREKERGGYFHSCSQSVRQHADSP
jgi:hypothetical protein